MENNFCSIFQIPMVRAGKKADSQSVSIVRPSVCEQSDEGQQQQRSLYVIKNLVIQKQQQK